MGTLRGWLTRFWNRLAVVQPAPRPWRGIVTAFVTGGKDRQPSKPSSSLVTLVMW
jgi:hypothetical protein